MQITMGRLRALIREVFSSEVEEFRNRIYTALDQLGEYQTGDSYSYDDVPMARLAELGIAPDEWAQHGDEEQDYSLSWHIDHVGQTVSFFLD